MAHCKTTLCDKCGLYFRNNVYKRHYRVCVGKIKVPATTVCRYCGVSFATSSGCGVHEIQCLKNPQSRSIQEGRPAWNKGLSKETNEIIRTNAQLRSIAMKGRPGIKWSQEQRQIASIRQSKIISENSLKYRRSKKSWMEQVFEEWLKENFIPYEDEVYSKDELNGTSYFIDFLIRGKNIIVELDGNHHQKPEMVVRDKKRDEFHSTLGFKTFRISHVNFKTFVWKEELIGLLV